MGFFDDAFGAAAALQDPDGDGVTFEMNLRFPGQHFNAETGLNYNYFRDYEPGTGRDVESDPIGLKGGIFTYGYGRQNPLTSTDPKGLQTEAALPICVLGGPANPACDGAVILNLCKWAGIGLGALVLSSDSADKCNADKDKCPKQKDCKQIKQQCLQMCSDTTLPTRDNGFSFFNCVNRCMADNGCEGQ